MTSMVGGMNAVGDQRFTGNGRLRVSAQKRSEGWVCNERYDAFIRSIATI